MLPRMGVKALRAPACCVMLETIPRAMQISAKTVLLESSPPVEALIPEKVPPAQIASVQRGTHRPTPLKPVVVPVTHALYVPPASIPLVILLSAQLAPIFLVMPQSMPATVAVAASATAAQATTTSPTALGRARIVRWVSTKIKRATTHAKFVPQGNTKAA